MGLALLYSITWVDKGVLVHVQGGKVLAGQGSDLVTDRIVKSRNYVAFFTIQSMKN